MGFPGRLRVRVLCLSVAWPPSIYTLSLSFPRGLAVSHSCEASLQAKAHNPASPHSFLPLTGLGSPHVAQQQGLFPSSSLKHLSYLACLIKALLCTPNHFAITRRAVSDEGPPQNAPAPLLSLPCSHVIYLLTGTHTYCTVLT